MKQPLSEKEMLAYGLRLVRITAAKYARILPQSWEMDDLVSCGHIGLLKAIRQYDPTLGSSFQTYAIALIRGAILEELRRQHPVTRFDFERRRRTERAERHLETTLGRPVTNEELARHLCIDVETLHQWQNPPGSQLLSLDTELSTGPRHFELLDVLSTDENMEDKLEAKERGRALGRAVARLPERERHVLTEHFGKERTFKAIGPDLGISESRVYQLYRQALVRLEGYLCDWQEKWEIA